jgi:hypothetical protein
MFDIKSESTPGSEFQLLSEWAMYLVVLVQDPSRIRIEEIGLERGIIVHKAARVQRWDGVSVGSEPRGSVCERFLMGSVLPF